MTTEEACEALHIGKNSLYNLIATGKLKAFRNKRTWKIPKQAIIEYIIAESRLQM
jgi:excisionase family DNA binding protein